MVLAITRSSTDGSLDAEEGAWLGQMLFADGKIDDEERKFLHELRGEAKQVSPEFEIGGEHETSARAAHLWIEG